MSKITMSTVKSFIRKNREALLISCTSRFDGSTDMVENVEFPTFCKARTDDHYPAHTLGIAGAFFAGGGQDLIRPLQSSEYVGFSISNAARSFELAVKL